MLWVIMFKVSEYRFTNILCRWWKCLSAKYLFRSSVDEVKSKMKNLRDTYGRCKKNDAAIKSGAPASSTPTWLDDFRKRRK